MLMEMAGSRSCGGRAFQDNGLDEENAREPNVVGRKAPHFTCDSHTSFKVKRSKVGVTDGRGHTRIYSSLITFV